MPTLMETLGLKSPESDAEALPDVDGSEFDQEPNTEYVKEFGEDFLEDEPPADLHKRRGRPPGKTKAAPVAKVSASQKKAVKVEIMVYAKLAALTFSARDPHCAAVFEAQSEQIADSITDLLARYPGVLDKFQQTGMIGDWLKLFMAVAPVANAVIAHHIIKDPTEGIENGVNNGFYEQQYKPYSPGRNAGNAAAGALG